MTKLTGKIIATGSYLPEKIVSNDDLAKTVETSNEWIVERTGIKQRHIAALGEFTSDIATEAAKKALQLAKINAEEIDAIVLATTTPDLTFPSTATIVQAKLGAKNAFAFDVQAVCSGFVYALNVANNFIKAGQAKNVLVIGADILSRIVDWQDRNTCVLFGDGAGAVILQAVLDDGESGILGCSLYSDGSLTDILKTSGGAAFNQKIGVIEMAGREVYKHAVEKMTKSVFDLLSKCEKEIKDVDWLVPHQANARILSAVASRLGISEEKVVLTVAKHANTSAASIPLALDFAARQGQFKQGDLLVLEALGGGLTWGSALLKW